MAARGREGRNGRRPKKRIEALADHILGYRTTAEPEVQRWGPQPPEGVLSVLLQEFPSYRVGDLLAEDWLVLEQILDYRRARYAVELFNGGERGFEQLQQRPDLLDLLLELGQAQGGPATTLEDVLGALREQQPKGGDQDG